MTVSNDISSATIHPKEETVFLPFGTKKSFKHFQVRNIAFIGIILGVIIPAVYLITDDVLFSQADGTIELESTENTVEYDISPTIDELPEIDELVTPIVEDHVKEEIKLSAKYDFWEFTGPFGISKTSYKIGEKVEFIAVNIPETDTGKIIFKRPNGDEFHVIDYDGSDGKFQKYSFIPMYYDVKKCPDCVIGKWVISINSNTGNYYRSITFYVIK